ncbi:MAG: type IX secretion system membrane protein PorP/SprF [Saprospiraceae bacterium]|nr:type IX secretion system membrane protein PorP/SprF [Saprospiraceae bacterium]
MRKTIILFVVSICFSNLSFAQQDAMFTKYMFNSLVYNPAYAGAKDHMALGVLHRTQWWDIEGGPNTQSFTIHTPLPKDRIGLGFWAVNDVIGPTHTISANLAYAYRIPMGNGKLSVGVQGGITNWAADWTKLDLFSPDDPAFSDANPNFLLPNFGVGVYYYSDKFYVGAASPRLIEYDLQDEPINTQRWAKQYRHYFFSTGVAIPLRGEQIVLKPSLLIKNVGMFSKFNKDENFEQLGAPTEFDIDVSVLFYKALWIGASFRSSLEVFIDDSSSFDSADIWASYYLTNGLRIGAAYDYTLTKLQTVAGGSFEIMLGYEFNYTTKRTVTPRYF